MHLTRQDKRRKRHSEDFNKMFSFFLQSYRHKILDFSGVNVVTKMNINGEDSKICFKRFDNGEYSREEVFLTGIPTRHPNILKGVIVGKKSWGLHVKMWSEGIAEGVFTKREILEQFRELNIEIPPPFIIDFENTIWKKMKMRQ